MTCEQKLSGLEGEGLSATYRFAYESIRKGAPGLSDTTCMAIARSINMKVSVAVIPTEARLRELEQELAQANANGAAHWGRATAAEAKLARAVEGLETAATRFDEIYEAAEVDDIAYRNEATIHGINGNADVAQAEVRQTLAALQQEGE